MRFCKVRSSPPWEGLGEVVCGSAGGRGDPPWMFDSRGDPPIVYRARGHPPWKYASRGDPPINSEKWGDPPELNNGRTNSFNEELVFRNIDCKNSLYGRGMPKNEGVIAIPSNQEKQSDSNVDQMDRITGTLKDCFVVPPRNDENQSTNADLKPGT